jgi:hypothetical protein
MSFSCDNDRLKREVVMTEEKHAVKRYSGWAAGIIYPCPAFGSYGIRGIFPGTLAAKDHY